MRTLTVVLFTLILAISTLGQTVKLNRGETGVRLEIEGRGTILIKLHVKEAPKTTAQFIKLVRDGFYNGQRFHRADRNPKPYLVQAGDPASKNGDLNTANMGSGGSGARIPFEDSGFANVEGAVGLARITDDIESGDSQFYILLANQPFLNGHYTVFGQVILGLDVVKKIEKGDRIAGVSIVQG